MSVLFMMPNWTAPSEFWLQRMLEELEDELGLVVSWNTGGETTWRNKVRAISLTQYPSGIDSILTRFGYKSNYYKPQQILLRELQNKELTHVLCHYGALAVEFMDVWRNTDIPLYIHFHGFDATFDLGLYDQHDKYFYTDEYKNNILELSERAIFIANSEFTKSLLKKAGVSPFRIRTKYLGVPLPKTKKTHANREEINILHLGRLVDFKSPDRTIKAFEIACSKGFIGQLILAGDGVMRLTCELLRERSDYKDSIHLTGAVSSDQARQLYEDADIYTQHNMKGEISHQEECFGVSIVEAMSYGLPIVGTRSGGVMETVIDGENGILCTPGDIDAQADAFLRLANNPQLRQSLGDKGRNRVIDQFSIKRERDRLRSIMQIPK